MIRQHPSLVSLKMAHENLHARRLLRDWPLGGLDSRSWFNPKPHVLVPYSGVCSEVIGCARAGWPQITAIEMQAEHVDVGADRLIHHMREAGYELKGS